MRTTNLNMIMKRIVELYLENGARIPRCIRLLDLNVRIEKVVIQGRKLRLLKIKSGEAEFLKGGKVQVRLPCSSKFFTAFREMKVLKIVTREGLVYNDLRTRKAVENVHLCPKCFALTATLKSQKPSEKAGKIDAKFVCITCGEKIERKNI